MRPCYSAVLCLLLGCRAAAAQQPFARLGVTVPVLTLSNGRYPEYFANDSLRRIGSVVYNRRLHRIAYLLPADSLTGHAPAQATSRWLSTDPITEPFSSPYVYVNNNPLNKVDPDGRSGIATIDKQNHTVTITSHMIYYGKAGSEEMAKHISGQIQDHWNNANGTAKIDGVIYKVKFVVTGEYKPALTNDEVKKNTDISNNYVLLQDEQPGLYHSSFGGNDGTFWTKEIDDGSNTMSHEYGHGLEGPKHLYNGRRLLLGHPMDKYGDVDAREIEGCPGIMWPRGTKVQSQYQRDPTVPAGYGSGGYLNPKERQANQADIDFIGLGDLKFNAAGQADVGIISPDPHKQKDPVAK